MHRNNGEQDVLIIGAGPSGLMAAIELARRGVHPRIVDCNFQAHKQSRATNIQAATMYSLDQQGSLTDFLSVATRLELIEVREPNWDLKYSIDLLAATGDFNFTLALPQWRTEAILAKHARHWDVEIERGVFVSNMTLRSDGTDVEFASPAGVERASFRHVIDAGGPHGPTRHALGQKLIGGEYPKRFIDAEVSIDTPFARNRIVRIPYPSGSMIWVPLPEGHSMLIFDVDEASPLAIPNRDVTLEDLRRLLTGVLGSDFNLRGMERASCFTVHHRMAEHFGDSRRHLIGDAGHIQSLFSGMGMNVGMQDAANLAWKLAFVLQGHADSNLISTYETERRAAALRSLAVSDAVYHEVVDGDDPNLLESSVADASLMLDVAYSESPLSVQIGVEAADNVAAGRLLRTTEIRYTDKLVLLAPPGLTDINELARKWKSVLDVHQQPPSSWPAHIVGVVRPDGYLGFVASATSGQWATSLNDYLSAWFNDFPTLALDAPRASGRPALSDSADPKPAAGRPSSGAQPKRRAK